MGSNNKLSYGEHYATINGIKLWYLVRGNGPVLLVQPGGAGWGGDASVYAEYLKPLEKIRTVIYLEPRGIGHSQRVEDISFYSMDEYVEETESFRKYLEVPIIALSGHSYGGYITLKYATKYPKNIERLLLLNTSPCWSIYDYEAWIKTRQGYDQAKIKQNIIFNKNLPEDEMLKEMMKIWSPVLHFYNYDSISKRFKKILNKMIFSYQPYNYTREYEFARYDVRPLLDQITKQALIVVGDDDTLASKLGSQILKEKLSNSKLAIIDKCGHWPMIECPNEFFKAVIPFLEPS